MDERYAQMLNWLNGLLPNSGFMLTPASEDASFRRYFRVAANGGTRIVMDAPPASEDSRPFVTIAKALQDLGLQTPQVFAADFQQGFLLLSDLGSQQYLSALDESNVDRLYMDALDTLARLQLGGNPTAAPLPRYDQALLQRELAIFNDWFVEKHLGLQLTASERRLLEQVFGLLIDNALEQPQVWVHRDFHSRNLMVTAQSNPGVLDFQGAVIGPVTYDLVSLLRDCYIAWPAEKVEHWALAYYDKLIGNGFQGLGEPDRFLRWFDIMGVQRHLKAIGIFARLNSRDGKTHYLREIPRTLQYILDMAGRHPELNALGEWLIQRNITPATLST